MRRGVPEFFHVYRGFEDKEDVSIVMGVEFLAIGAKVLGAERTTVPLSDNAKQVPVTKREAMCKVAQISYRYF